MHDDCQDHGCESDPLADVRETQRRLIALLMGEPFYADALDFLPAWWVYYLADLHRRRPGPSVAAALFDCRRN